jgi:hypothetical protein
VSQSNLDGKLVLAGSRVFHQTSSSCVLDWNPWNPWWSLDLLRRFFEQRLTKLLQSYGQNFIKFGVRLIHFWGVDFVSWAVFLCNSAKLVQNRLSRVEPSVLTPVEPSYIGWAEFVHRLSRSWPAEPSWGLAFYYYIGWASPTWLNRLVLSGCHMKSSMLASTSQVCFLVWFLSLVAFL